MHLSTRQGGFSLIEVVVAVAILGLACIAVSGVLTNALHAERSLERRRHLESVLAAEGERLAALPYYRRADGAEWPATPASLLGEVFPHASPACNVPEASYADGSGAAPAGAFVSDRLADELRVHRVARFVAVSPVGLEPVAVETLWAWAVWSDALPPAGLIEVELQASWRGRVADELGLATTLVRPPAGMSPDRAVCVEHRHDGVPVETVLLAWDPARRVLWRKAPGSYLADHVAKFAVDYFRADGRRLGSADFAAAGWPQTVARIDVVVDVTVGGCSAQADRSVALTQAAT